MSAQNNSLIARVHWRESAHYARPLDAERLELMRGTPLSGLDATGDVVALADVRPLPPVEPTKILGIGANFEGPEAPTDRTFPSVFLMPPSALLAAGAPIVLPRLFGSVMAEGELGVVISKRCKAISAEAAAAHVLGYTVVNDLSGRDSTLQSVPAAIKKGCDGFLPVGPYLRLDPELRDFQIQTTVNGELVQAGNTRDMIFGVYDCISHISQAMTLEPGDLICLGTPPPKPKVAAGDVVRVTISEIGTLVNEVTRA